MKTYMWRKENRKWTGWTDEEEQRIGLSRGTLAMIEK